MRVIGLMSGTSVDGIDAALVEISGTTTDLTVDLIAGMTCAYPTTLRSQILAVCAGAPLTMLELAALDDGIAQAFAQAALTLQTNHPAAHLIGSHGQTVFHRPVTTDPQSLGYSLQLGRGALIAHLTQIPTISNFRAADIAMQGQGAPLVSAIDRVLLCHPTKNRCIQNIGGIANVTYLPANTQPSPHTAIFGWDTGPGNALLDLAVQHLSQGELTYDRNGAWAAQGIPCQRLVDRWLQQDFFHLAPPKSTGREQFGQDYWQQCYREMTAEHLSHADMLATLTELTVASIAQSYHTFLPQLPDQTLLCGGGSHNQYLKTRLQSQLKSTEVCTTDDVGLNADFKEAIAFAVLAYWHQQGIPGNLPEVTGAKQAVPLGELHLVTRQDQPYLAKS